MYKITAADDKRKHYGFDILGKCLKIYYSSYFMPANAIMYIEHNYGHVFWIPYFDFGHPKM